MNKNIKVEKTHTYNDIHRNSYLVCKGKLVLMPTNEEPSDVVLSKMIGNNNIYRGFGSGFKNKEYYTQVKPIIISEMEVIKDGDICYYANNLGGGKFLCKAKNAKFGRVYQELGISPISLYGSKEGGITPLPNEIFKVLALPEHFSSETLKDITNGIYKNGDEVNIECENIAYKYEKENEFIVKVLGRNVNIFPINTTDTITERGLDILKEELEKADVRKYTCVNGFGYSQLERDIVERILNLK